MNGRLMRDCRETHARQSGGQLGMKLFGAALLAAHAAWGQTLPLYKNPDAPLEKRVDDLLSRMTAEEKISPMMNDSPAIERLGIPAYNWWNECLHGVAQAGRATVLPEPIGLAATWDPQLIFYMATAISDEARAKKQRVHPPRQAEHLAGPDVLDAEYQPRARSAGAAAWWPMAKIPTWWYAWPLSSSKDCKATTRNT
jgi:beta-glucosidase-like glycosyl hydrolase